MKFTIKLVTIPDIKEFCRICNEIPDDVYVTVNKYTVDGKSIMGMFSLDLTKTLQVTVPAEYGEMFKDMDIEVIE